MTDMKRITVSLPEEINEALTSLKKSDEFKNEPYSRIICKLIERGLKVEGVKK